MQENAKRIYARVVVGVTSIALLALGSLAQRPEPFNLMQPRVQQGQTFGNIFSKTVSYRGGGVDDQAHTVGGTALYRVLDADPTHLRVHSGYRYDGRSTGEGDAEIRDSGTSNCNPSKNKCVPARDSSGPVYNAFLWGTPPTDLHKGDHWTVALREPWELGPAGTETVTVLAIDKAEGEVMLRREGEGSGLFDSEDDKLKLKKSGKDCDFTMVPGVTHWVGVATFRYGVTVSDEVLERRDLQLASKGCGSATAEERQFTLLMKAPNSLL